MRQACLIETHRLAYRQKFLQSYRKAGKRYIRRAHPEAWGALAASVPVVMVMVPMVAAPMVAALPTDEQQANHQQPHPVFHVPRKKRHRTPPLSGFGGHRPPAKAVGT
jgi:hypothetical protein